MARTTATLPTTTDAAAPRAGMLVVAAKVPRVCIIRAFSTAWHRPDELIEEVLRYVGTLNGEVEWTAHTYEGRPYYWHNDVVGVSPYGGGVYRWNYSGDEYQGRDSNCYREFVGLLHLPQGWAAIKPQGTDLAGNGFTDSGAT